MIIRTLITGLVCVLLAAPLFASGEGAVYLRYVEGGVQVLPSGTQRWVPAAVNTPVSQGDSLRIAKAGNAELLTRDGSLFRITSGSRLKVISVERSAIQVYLENGKVYVNFSGVKGYPLFLNTSSAQIDVLERATFRVDIDHEGNTQISVLAGEILVVQKMGKMKVIAGTRLVMKKDGSRPLYTKPRPADEWERWNRARDNEMRSSSDRGQRRAPAEPQTYYTGPDGGGRQVPSEEYVIVESAPAYVFYYPRYYRTYPCGGWYGPCYRGFVGPGYWHGGYRRWWPYRGRPGPGRGPHRRPRRW